MIYIDLRWKNLSTFRWGNVQRPRWLCWLNHGPTAVFPVPCALEPCIPWRHSLCFNRNSVTEIPSDACSSTTFSLHRVYRKKKKKTGEDRTCHTVGGDVSWCSHRGKQSGGSLKIPKWESPPDPAAPLLGVHPEKNVVRKDTWTPVFTAALFTIAKSWKQPNVHR